MRSAASSPFMPGQHPVEHHEAERIAPPFRLRCSSSASPSSAVATDTGGIDQLRSSVSSRSRLVSVSSTMSTGRSATPAGATRAGASGLRLDAQTRGEEERRALARRALDRQVAAHQARQPPADHEPEARAAVLPGRRAVGLRERLEQPRLLLRGNADAGV